MAKSATGRPRTRPTEERRRDLMNAAEKLFLLKGVDQTTIDDITLSAGVSKGAFYLHFSSKTEVLDALRARFVEQLLDGIVKEVDSRGDGDWLGKLGAWVSACTQGYMNSASTHDLVFAAAAAPNREGMTSNPLIDNLATLLEAGRHAGAWSLDNPAFSAVFLFNALHGVVNRTGAADGDRSDIVRRIEDHFQRVVGANKKPVGLPTG